MSKSAPTIAFDYRPSKLWLAALILVAFLAVIAVMISGVAWGIKLLSLIVILVQASYSVRYFNSPLYDHIILHSDGYWTLSNKKEQSLSATLLSFTHQGWLLVVYLKTENKKLFSLWLLPDNLDEETRRHLRVRLFSLEKEK